MVSVRSAMIWRSSVPALIAESPAWIVSAHYRPHSPKIRLPRGRLRALSPKRPQTATDSDPGFTSWRRGREKHVLGAGQPTLLHRGRETYGWVRFRNWDY